MTHSEDDTKESNTSHESLPPASESKPSPSKMNTTTLAPSEADSVTERLTDDQAEQVSPLPSSDPNEQPPDPPQQALVSQSAPVSRTPSPARVLDDIPQQFPPPPPIVQEPTLVNLIDEYVALVLEVVPDVLPAHVYGLIEDLQYVRHQLENTEEYQDDQDEDVVELVLRSLFEDPSYPKVDNKGKQKYNDANGSGSGDEGRASPQALDIIPEHEQPLPDQPQYQQPSLVGSIDEYVARILEIVPDVLPAYVFDLVEECLETEPEEEVVDLVVECLFEDPTYPKVEKKEKRKRNSVAGAGDNNERQAPRKIDSIYISKERVYDCGPHYFDRSLEQLVKDFPHIPKPFIRSELLKNRFYAPTYFLLTEVKRNPLPFKLKSTNSDVRGTGKLGEDPEFDKELDWVVLRVRELAVESGVAVAAPHRQGSEDNAKGVECGCCFAPYRFEHMIQCPEAHLFCTTCMTHYASNLLGEHNPNIVCMDQSGCKLAFPDSELGRFLSSKLLALYYRVKQRKEIEAAGLENLEECPFCEYKCVIENEMERLFTCESEDCGAVSCRLCKKLNHLPKTCSEVAENDRLDAKHIVEEAMTKALVRSCPTCQKPFLKERGTCNKMVCPNCRTISCYICREVISGYNHFSNPPYGSEEEVDTSKCSLWTSVEKRSGDEVSRAGKRAIDQLRKAHPELDTRDLHSLVLDFTPRRRLASTP